MAAGECGVNPDWRLGCPACLLPSFSPSLHLHYRLLSSALLHSLPFPVLLLPPCRWSSAQKMENHGWENYLFNGCVVNVMNCKIPYFGLPVYGWTDAACPGTNALYLRENALQIPENTVSGFSWVRWAEGSMQLLHFYPYAAVSFNHVTGGYRE